MNNVKQTNIISFGLNSFIPKPKPWVLPSRPIPTLTIDLDLPLNLLQHLPDVSMSQTQEPREWDEGCITLYSLDNYAN